MHARCKVQSSCGGVLSLNVRPYVRVQSAATSCTVSGKRHEEHVWFRTVHGLGSAIHRADSVALGFRKSRSTLPSPFISLGLTLRRQALRKISRSVDRSGTPELDRLSDRRSRRITDSRFQVRCFSTVLHSGTCPLSTAFVRRDCALS
jgi:hypothetical protein